MDTSGVRKILIIKPSALGDIVHALPVAAALKRSLPAAAIDWVVFSGYAEILEDNPAIRNLIRLDRDILDGKGRLGRLKRFLGELRRERYDLVIDLQGLLRSALVSAACRSGVRLGFGNARELAPIFYTEKIEVPDPAVHAVERYMLSLDHLGLGHGGAAEFPISISGKDEERAGAVLAELGIKDGEPFIAVAPSARWATKRWPAERFVRLSEMLLGEYGIRSVFIGSREDSSLFDGATGGAARFSYAFGRTALKSLAALLRRSRLLVTNDSGPMHIAAAVGTPVAALFGPTDPARTGPYGAGHVVLRAGLDCSPCFKRECAEPRCMYGLSVEHVFGEIKANFLER